ncbi:MauE/DoxX family redox-associated membrane protein [Sphingobacterium wenxiniae]|uniref:Methylamine utilisation protein MauE domain-containing protein n=1 Tax=Sphingobacterium wenxiniae TaxID=683125 RepID=A0A1I6PHS8_9SPHI|nr:MauE/DoxX family redox-associated membrane protein [Sphingobacterium wenxiniae]SFS39754.1 hypothetical protein SAMN05660206_101477 [Sphingobacterium wenxiniae]
MKTQLRHIAAYSIRIFLMVFWLYVALDKLWGLPTFHYALLRQPFPNWWADILYWALPLAELGIALLFLISSPFSVIQPIHQLAERSELGKRESKGVTRSASSSSAQALSKGAPFLLSALLLLAFTIYIALGVAGFYAQRPCGCASVFSGLSWDWHLLANIVLLGLSILGKSLYESSAPTDHGTEQYAYAGGGQPTFVSCTISFYHFLMFMRKRFPRRFAPFPGRPVDE